MRPLDSVLSGHAANGSVNARMLLHQLLAFSFQFGDFGVDVFDFLLDVVVVFLEQFLGFLKVRRRRCSTRSGLLAVSFMVTPVIRPTTAITIR